MKKKLTPLERLANGGNCSKCGDTGVELVPLPTGGAEAVHCDCGATAEDYIDPLDEFLAWDPTKQG